MQDAVGMNKQMVESMSPSDKRKMSPGQEKAALWPKKKKGTGSARRGALGNACVCMLWSLCKRDLVLEQSSVLSLTDTGAGRRIWGSSVKIAKRFILVIQPETQQMWEEKVWAGWLIAMSPAQYFEPEGLSELCQRNGESCTRTVSAGVILPL